MTVARLTSHGASARQGRRQSGYGRAVHPIEHLRYVARAQGADPSSLVEETAHALGSLHFDPSGLVVACRRIVERHPFTGALWWLCANVVTSAEPFEAVWELADAIRSDRTGAELAAVLPDEATVVTIGDPDVIGDGLIRRGDVRVLALDAGYTATSFVRRLERYDVDVEAVDAGVGRCGGPPRRRRAGRGAGRRLRSVCSSRAGRRRSLRRRRRSGPRCGSWPGSGGACRPASSMRWSPRSMRWPRSVDPWGLDVEVLPTSMFTHVVGPHGKVPMGPPAIVAECPMAHELLRPSHI